MMVNITAASSPYYPPPYSLPQLPHHIRIGLIVIGTLAVLSILSTSSLLIYLTYDYITTRQRRHKQRNSSTTPSSGSNSTSRRINTTQCTTLIFNLLTADLLQSLALVISFHWVSLNGIFAPTPACWVQAGFLHIGDTASGAFVLAIAAQTMWSVMRGRRIERKWFLSAVGAIWFVVIILTISGPAKYGEVFFTRAGNWCWVSQDYQSERLWLHYFWIFLDEFGTVTIYIALVIYLLRRMSFFSRDIPASLPTQQPIERNTTPNSLSLHRTHSTTPPSRASTRISKATRTMLLYPSVYVVLTLPLATLRMISVSGGKPSDTALLVAGAMLTSCGWIDALVYALTRHILVRGDRKPGRRRRRRDTEVQNLSNAENGFSRRRTTSDLHPNHSKETLASFSGRESVGGVEMGEHLEEGLSPFTHPQMFAQRAREQRAMDDYFGEGIGDSDFNDAAPRSSTPQQPQLPAALLKPPSVKRKESYAQSLGGIRKETTVEISYSSSRENESSTDKEHEVESKEPKAHDDIDDSINGSKTKTRYSGKEWRAQLLWAGG